MAKRFIDTRMFEDEWFSDLSKDGKMFFIYYITTCDHAGMFKLNKKLCRFQTDIESTERVIEEFGNCLVRVKEDLYFMPKYILFQYPNFPKSTVVQQVSAVKLLKSYPRVWEEFVKGYLTVNEELIDSDLSVMKELGDSYVNDNASDNANASASGDGGVSEKKLDVNEVKELTVNRTREGNVKSQIPKNNKDNPMVAKDAVELLKEILNTPYDEIDFGEYEPGKYDNRDE